MFKNILTAILLIFAISFHSQSLREIDTSNYVLRKKLIDNYKKENEIFYKNLRKKHKGKLRTEITNIYKNSDKEFLKNIQKKRFIFDKRFTSYTDSIVNLIVSKNNQLKDKNITVYISKTPSINALNLGKGIFVLNIGLFKYLENDDQLISVLTHEIAHSELKHVENNIIYRGQLNISKERKEQAKKIRKQQYNQYDKSFKILKNLMYSDSKTHRKKEIQADSVGYLLYKNTLLYKPNYLGALKLLAKYETIPSIEIDSTIYKTIFNIPSQPFKKSWLKMEEFSNYNYSNYKEKINKDSIKSHPEFVERITKLEKDFPELKICDSLIISEKTNFKELQELARKEDIVNLYDLKEYGQSIRLILYKLSKKPSDTYLKKWLGKNFISLYEAKKKYQFNRHIAKNSPKNQTKNYQQFLNFMWNLKLNEIKIIGNYYSKN